MRLLCHLARKQSRPILHPRHLCLKVERVLPSVQLLLVLTVFVFVCDSFAERGGQFDLGQRRTRVVAVFKPVGETLVSVLRIITAHTHTASATYISIHHHHHYSACTISA